MNNEKWLLCPVCQSKTRTMVIEETELKNFPLFCPRCKNETLINMEQMNITVIKEPDARRRADNQQD